MNFRKSLFLALVLLVSVSAGSILIWHGLNLDQKSLPITENNNSQVLGDQSSQILASPVVSPAASVPSANLDSRYLVTKVIDGDTFQINYNGQLTSVRLIGIDTPETVDPRRPVGCFGKKASDETKRLLEGKEVILTKDVSDRDK